MIPCFFTSSYYVFWFFLFFQMSHYCLLKTFKKNKEIFLCKTKKFVWTLDENYTFVCDSITYWMKSIKTLKKHLDQGLELNNMDN